MIKFTDSPDHVIFEPAESCACCEWLEAHERLSDWVAARSVISWAQQNAI